MNSQNGAPSPHNQESALFLSGIEVSDGFLGSSMCYHSELHALAIFKGFLKYAAVTRIEPLNIQNM